MSQAKKSIASVFGTDSSLETEGIKLDYGDYGAVWVARAGGKNKAFSDAMERRLRPYRSGIQLGTVDNEVVEKITRECFAEFVVLDWDFVDENGEPIPYSPEKCAELFEQYPDFFNEIMQQAQRVVNFVRETREHDGKS